MQDQYEPGLTGRCSGYYWQPPEYFVPFPPSYKDLNFPATKSVSHHILISFALMIGLGMDTSLSPTESMKAYHFHLLMRKREILSFHMDIYDKTWQSL